MKILKVKNIFTLQLELFFMFEVVSCYKTHFIHEI